MRKKSILVALILLTSFLTLPSAAALPVPIGVNKKTPKINRKNIVLPMMILVLLMLSLYSFYNAYQLLKTYQKTVHEEILIIPGVSDKEIERLESTIETYYRYFPLYLFGGLVTIGSAMIVFAFQTKLIHLHLGKPFVSFQPRTVKLGVKGFTFTLGIVVLGLLIIGGFFFCGAYDLWREYQNALLVDYPLPHFDYAKMIKPAIENYWKWFLPYFMGGLVMISLASNILVLGLKRPKNHLTPVLSQNSGVA